MPLLVTKQTKPTPNFRYEKRIRKREKAGGGSNPVAKLA